MKGQLKPSSGAQSRGVVRESPLASLPARRRSDHALAAVRPALASLRSEKDPNKLLGRLATEAYRLASPAFSCILLRAEPQRGWAPVAMEPRDGSEAPSDLRFPAGPGTLLGSVIESRTAAWVTGADGELDAMDVEQPADANLRALGLIPIICEGVVFGVLALAWHEANDLPERERVLIEALAEHTGVLLELTALNRELESGLRAELVQRAEGAEALHRVAAEVAGRRDVRAIAEDAVSAIRSHYGADAGAFYLVDDDTGAIRSLVHAGLPAGYVERVEQHYTGGGRTLFWEGRTQVIEDVEHERRAPLRETLKEAAIETVVRVPALADHRVVGGLVLYHRQQRHYRPHEIALLEAFAVQLAGSVRLIEAYGALEVADRQREEFLALISHELRHPVAAIATVADTLADTPGLGAREQRALNGLRSQARQLARLAEEVLHIARLETGMVQLRPASLDLGLFLKALVREDKANERILVTVPREPMTVKADPELFGSCIDNLLRNALKYSPESAAVEVVLSREEGCARIDVRDQGIGLTQEELASLFKKYGRFVNERTSGIEGVGLGLYLTKMLVEAHGGTLSAQSDGPYRGSTFTIKVPHE